MSNKSDRANEFINNANSIINPYTTFIGSVEDNSSVEQKDDNTPVKMPKNDVKKDNKSVITIDNYKYKDKNKYISKNINGKKTKIIDNDKGKYSKDDNYTITFKIDADIEDYLKNISYISFIETQTKGIDATEYVNKLIREDMLKTLNIDASEKDPNKWIDAYNKYKSKKGL